MPETLPREAHKAVAERDDLHEPDPALLVDITPDRLTLHTRDAYWLFAGRGWDEEGIEHRIIGGQRAAAVLNAMRHASVGGNPYADWFLVCFDEQLTELRTGIAERVTESEELLDALKKKGIVLNVLASRQPLELTVAFGSAYGYAIAEAVVEFDYYVRIVRTFVLKNRIRPDDGRAAIRGIGRPLRRLFVRSIRWERALSSSELRDITVRDFLPTADGQPLNQPATATDLPVMLSNAAGASRVFTGDEPGSECDLRTRDRNDSIRMPGLDVPIFEARLRSILNEWVIHYYCRHAHNALRSGVRDRTNVRILSRSEY